MGKIRETKDKEVPAGYQWQGASNCLFTHTNHHDLRIHTGIIDQYEKDQKLPLNEHYLWHLRMEGDIKLVVTMNSALVTLIHTALYFVGDYTFKRVHGELDECEFVIWHAPTNERECGYFLFSASARSLKSHFNQV